MGQTYPARNTPKTATTASTTAQEIIFDLTLQERYALRRRDHYRWLHQTAMFLIILMGAAVATDIAAHPAIALLIAGCGIADVVFRWSDKACHQNMLYQRSAELLTRLNNHEITPEQAGTQYKQIETTDEKIYWAVEADCYNEATHALGRDTRYLVKLTPWQKITMHWLSHAATHFPQPERE